MDGESWNSGLRCRCSWSARTNLYKDVAEPKLGPINDAEMTVTSGNMLNYLGEVSREGSKLRTRAGVVIGTADVVAMTHTEPTSRESVRRKCTGPRPKLDRRCQQPWQQPATAYRFRPFAPISRTPRPLSWGSGRMPDGQRPST